MPFTDFKTLASFQRQYQIVKVDADFVELRPHTVRQVTRDHFAWVEKYFGLSGGEGGVLQRVIFPVLEEVYWSFAPVLAMQIQEWFGLDDPLCGYPDYVLGQRSPLGVDQLERPFVLVIEAKKDDFDAGWGQCGAAMLTAQKLNEDHKGTVYGVVTNGRLWNIGKLQDSMLTVERRFFALIELDPLCSALRWVMEQGVAQVRRYAPAA